MNNLHFSPKNHSYESKLVFHPSSKFFSFDLDMNETYLPDKRANLHIVYLLKGEILIKRKKHKVQTLKEGQFFFVPNAEYDCLAMKDSRIIIYTVDKREFIADEAFQKEIMAVMVGLRKLRMPEDAPIILSIYFENLADLLDHGIDDLVLQEIKRKELFLLLTALYSVNGMAELLLYDQFSLS